MRRWICGVKGPRRCASSYRLDATLREKQGFRHFARCDLKGSLATAFSVQDLCKCPLPLLWPEASARPYMSVRASKYDHAPGSRHADATRPVHVQVLSRYPWNETGRAFALESDSVWGAAQGLLPAIRTSRWHDACYLRGDSVQRHKRRFQPGGLLIPEDGKHGACRQMMQGYIARPSLPPTCLVRATTKRGLDIGQPENDKW